MGLVIDYLKSETLAMKTYDEQTTERLFLTSDKRVVVPEDDSRARFLLSIHGPVTRAKAREIRGYTDGEKYLEPCNPADVPAPTAPPAPAVAPAAPIGEGPDRIVDWGKAHLDKRVGDLPDKYLASLTKGKNPEDRKALAVVEIARRGIPAPVAPPAPLNYGPDDIVSIGIHQNVAVRDLPKDFLIGLANGAEEIHHAWAKAELQRLTDEA